IPWIIKLTIEAIGRGGGGARGSVTVGALCIIGLALLQGLVRTASRFALLGASQRVEADIRNDLFRRLLRLPPAYYQTQRTGDLMSRATNDLLSVVQLIGFGFLSLVNTGLVFAGTLIAMLHIDPWLTAAALGPAPFLVFAGKRWSAHVHRQSLA